MHQQPTIKEPPVSKNTVLSRPARAERVKNHERMYLLILSLDMSLLNFILYLTISYQIPFDQLSGALASQVIGLFSIANLLWLIVASFTDIYWIVDRIRLELKIKNLFNGSLMYFGILSAIYYYFFYESFEIHFVFPAFMIFTFWAIGLHYVVRSSFHRRAKEFKYAVIGGKPTNLRYLEKSFRAVYGEKSVCKGRFANNDILGVNRLGGYDTITDYVEGNQLDKLLYISSDLSNDEVRRLMFICRAKFIEFEIIPREVDLFEKGLHVEQLDHLPVFCRKKEPLYRLRNKLMKRSFDLIVSSLFLLVFFLPIFLVVAILIKLEDPTGPIFFKQKRTGYWNNSFNLLKFRSMKVNKDSDAKQATKGDMRITRIGAFLRKSNLDEIPQFINVFLGHMSLIGPRPHMLKHTEDYARLIEQFMIRHEVKPGITGWAQVSGWRGPTETVDKMEKRVEHDVHYIENWNIWFDFKILLMTVVNMIKGEENAH